MRWWIVVWLALVTKGAVAEPSFDCTKATSLAEREICKDARLAFQDKLLSKFYVFLKGQPHQDETLSGQLHWTEKRDLCGTDWHCLYKRYSERIDELAVAAGKLGQVTGTYGYNFGSLGYDGHPTNFGTAYIVLQNDGTLFGSIDTISAHSFNMCGVEFENAHPLGDTWIWQTGSEEAEEDKAIVLIRFENDKLRIDAINGRSFCGAHGHFEETYARVK
jgi:uncharacterized protein